MLTRNCNGGGWSKLTVTWPLSDANIYWFIYSDWVVNNFARSESEYHLQCSLCYLATTSECSRKRTFRRKTKQDYFLTEADWHLPRELLKELKYCILKGKVRNLFFTKYENSGSQTFETRGAVKLSIISDGVPFVHPVIVYRSLIKYVFPIDFSYVPAYPE